MNDEPEVCPLCEQQLPLGHYRSLVCCHDGVWRHRRCCPDHREATE